MKEHLQYMDHQRKMQEMIHIKYMLEDEVADRRKKMLLVKVGF